MLKPLKKLKCWWSGHKWDSTHGYRNLPNPGAHCERCDLTFNGPTEGIINGDIRQTN